MLTKAAQDFGREAGLEVNVQYMGSTQVLAKLRAERAQPRTDVWIGAGV
jgi:ABC-type Fe3+ transport system substrate-binding protein